MKNSSIVMTALHYKVTVRYMFCNGPAKSGEQASLHFGGKPFHLTPVVPVVSKYSCNTAPLSRHFSIDE